MSESKIETANYSTSIVEDCTSPLLYNDEAFHAAQNSTNFGIISQAPYGNDIYQRRNSDIIDNAWNNWQQGYQRSSSTNTIDQIGSTNVNQYPLNQDPNPEHIHRQNNERITYRQDVAIRYLQPPTPPPSGPVIIREIHAPQPPEAPPLVIHQRPPVPVTPPPIVIRERPPVPPPIEPSRIVNKYLPAPPPVRKVIIERQEPLPQKPQPVIIEKWLPYKPQPERRVVVERAQPIIEKPIQKNTVITYDAPHVNLVKNIRNLGTVRVDPRSYTAQYGSNLASSDYVLNTMTKYGIKDNYTQTIQMQTSPHASVSSSNTQMIQMQTSPHASVSSNTYNTYGERTAYQLQNRDYHEFIEDTVLPDGHRRHHSNMSGSSEQEILRQAEIFN